MKIVKANVTHPMYLPTGVNTPAKLKILAYDLELDKPDRHETLTSTTGTDWIIAHFGPLIQFYSDDLRGVRPVAGPQGEEEQFFEGYFNIDHVTPESVFPVYVRTKTHEEKILFAPVSFVKNVLSKYVNGQDDVIWTLHPDFDWARQGLVVFDLESRKV